MKYMMTTLTTIRGNPHRFMFFLMGKNTILATETYKTTTLQNISIIFLTDKGVAPITHLRTCVIKIVHIQRRQYYVQILLFHTMGNFS